MSDVTKLATQAVAHLTAAITAHGPQIWTVANQAVQEMTLAAAPETPAERAGQAPAPAPDPEPVTGPLPGPVTGPGVGVGVLRRLAQRPESRPALEAAVADLAADTHDEDLVTVLRVQVKKILAADQQLAADIAALLKTAPIAAGAGSQVISNSRIGGDAFQIGTAGNITIGERRSATVHGDNSGIVFTGDNARNVQMRAEATGSGRVYQAGRDQIIHEK
ncbi:hypothetical protein [Herbidospora daliensis]|uniref:hypothetical protein n=1 Tax=Herbidospora daliensis TaxID=295585 RepID=UPI0007820CC9|nr:hypothetical protein [Herbidospora daliensis]